MRIIVGFAVSLMFVGSSALAAKSESAPLAGPTIDRQSAANSTGSRLTIAQYYYQPARPSVGYGPKRRPTDSEVPLPGSGRRIPVSAADAAAGSWTGCQNWRNRFKEPFQRCCSMSRGVRRCYDQY